MRLLLDTHTFLWFIAGDAKLSKVARGLIEDPANDVLLSVISLWEIAIKVSIHKLPLASSIAELIRDDVKGNAIVVLPSTIDHVIAFASLPLHHRDPFDRLLIAQALAEKPPIVGADVAFDAYGVQRLW